MKYRFDELAERLWASIFLLCFGLATLGLLVAMERETWFHIKPASGVAAAMYNASHQPAETPAKEGRTPRTPSPEA